MSSYPIHMELSSTGRGYFNLAIWNICRWLKRVSISKQAINLYTYHDKGGAELGTSEACKPVAVQLNEFTIDSAEHHIPSHFDAGELRLSLHLTGMQSTARERPLAGESQEAKSGQSEKPSSFADEQLHLLQQKSTQLHCRHCGQMLLDSSSFHRVLPLPSSDWAHMSSLAFCHKHTDNNGNRSVQDKNSPSSKQENADCGSIPGPACLLPRPGDCLVGDSHVLLHANDFSERTIVEDRCSGAVCCSRCMQQIGRTVNDAKGDAVCFKVFLFSLVSEPHSLPSPSFERAFARFLRRHVQETGTHRFTVDFRHIGCGGGSGLSTCLLLWVLQADYAVAHTELLQPTSFTQRSVQHSASTTSTKTAADEPVPCQPSLRFQSAVKCLYKPIQAEDESDRKTCDAWSRDVHVQSIELTENLALQLFFQLVESTGRVPPCLRQSQGFHTGYLVCGEHKW